MVLPKGMENSSIKHVKVPTYNPSSIYKMQENILMDKSVIKLWVTEVLVP
jgi:hypothetical protein